MYIDLQLRMDQSISHCCVECVHYLNQTRRSEGRRWGKRKRGGERLCERESERERDEERVEKDYREMGRKRKDSV